MIRIWGIFSVLYLAACGPSAAPEPSPKTERPSRIVSLDYCADQYVLKMVERENILALSPDAETPFSYLRDAAKGIPTVRANAEDVLILKPDLVVRSYGGGPNATGFFEKAGIPVLNIGWAGDIEGIKRVTAEMADGLGVPEKGAEIIADIDTRLENLADKNQGKTVLYMTPSGTTSGPDSMVHEMIEAAGLKNFQTDSGWKSLPLERLTYEQPDMVAAAFFDIGRADKDAWSAMRHPIARKQMSELPTVALSSSWVSCGAWFAIDGIEALAGKPSAAPRL